MNIPSPSPLIPNDKVMVKWPLCIIKHHAVKMYGAVTLDGGGWSASHPSHQLSTINYFIKNRFFCSVTMLLVWRLYGILGKECQDYEDLSFKSVKHIKMIQALKCDDRA
jgi:hypothetical protein